MAEQELSQWDIEGEQEITLAPGEGLPGFPGGHGPGVYLVDFKNRTIRPKPVDPPANEQEIILNPIPDTNEGG